MTRQPAEALQCCWCLTLLIFLHVVKSQEKITKEMNYILGNQDSIQAQITQVESGIAQTEVPSIGVYETNTSP